jgi:hypothetical protein
VATPTRNVRVRVDGDTTTDPRWTILRRVPAGDADPFADFAAQCIGATLGVQVEPWDRHGRQGAHDLRCEHQGRSVVVEVCASSPE